MSNNAKLQPTEYLGECCSVRKKAIRTFCVSKALQSIKYDTGGFRQWVHRLTQRAPRNKVVVAIANKLARMAWAVLSSGKDYQHPGVQMTTA